MKYTNEQIEAIAGSLRADGFRVVADMMDTWVAERNAAKPEIKPEDIQVSSYPPRGPGMAVGMPKGVIILHKSGLSTACDASRTQHHNRDVAMRGLAAMLAEIQECDGLSGIEVRERQERKP